MNTDLPAELKQTGLAYSKSGNLLADARFPNFGLIGSKIWCATQCFASKYKLLLPSEKELRAEIETQKTFWIKQHGDALK